MALSILSASSSNLSLATPTALITLSFRSCTPPNMSMMPLLWLYAMAFMVKSLLLQILLKAGRELHLVRSPVVTVLPIYPVRRDLIAFLAHHDRYGSMLYSRIYGTPEYLLHLLWSGRCGDIPVPRLLFRVCCLSRSRRNNYIGLIACCLLDPLLPYLLPLECLFSYIFSPHLRLMIFQLVEYP